MKKLLICIFLFLGTSSVSAENVIPLKLSIKTDKKVYSEGEQIQLFYSIENVSDKPVGFFEYFGADFHSYATAQDNQPLESYSYSFQSMMPHAGDYIKLAQKEKLKEKEEIFGTVVFDEIKDYKSLRANLCMLPKRFYITAS